MMKDIIHNILEQYTGKEANLDSLALREMITDEIVDELKLKYSFTEIQDHKLPIWDNQADSSLDMHI